MPLVTLYLEELKATMRGRFAWAGAAALLLAVGGLAAVGTQDAWLDGYGIIAYGLAPLGFLPVAALMIANPRANRFVESVFTAPVERRYWLAAKILVLLTFAAAYYAALLPMMLVYVWHIGLPPLLQKFLLWTPGLLIACVAAGALIGVLFIGRSLAAPAGASMGLLLVYAGLIPLQELMVARGNGASLSGHVTLASPAVLLKNALGFALAIGSVPATTAMSWLSLALVVGGAFALAIWIFLYAQGVETWEATRAQRWIIGLALAALFLIPVLLADTDYDRPAPPANNAPAIRGLFLRVGAGAALVASGEAAPERCCSTILNRDDWPLGTDESARRDLLLFLPVDTARRIESLHIRISGKDGLVAAPAALDLASPQLEKRDYPGDSGPADASSHHIAQGWVARIPVTLNPTHPWDIGGDRYPLDVSVTYAIAGSGETGNFEVRAAIAAQVASALYEMAVAGSLLPLLCLGAALVRWRRTR